MLVRISICKLFLYFQSVSVAAMTTQLIWSDTPKVSTVKDLFSCLSQMSFGVGQCPKLGGVLSKGFEDLLNVDLKHTVCFVMLSCSHVNFWTYLKNFIIGSMRFNLSNICFTSWRYMSGNQRTNEISIRFKAKEYWSHKGPFYSLVWFVHDGCHWIVLLCPRWLLRCCSCCRIKFKGRTWTTCLPGGSTNCF